MDNAIHDAIISETCDIFSNDWTGSIICRFFNVKCLDLNNKSTPYVNYKTMQRDNMSKKEAFYQNIISFNPEEQAKIILELCDDYMGNSTDRVLKLKHRLIEWHKDLLPDLEGVDNQLVDECKNMLEIYPESNSIYLKALSFYDLGGIERDVIDNMRLALEVLFKKILGNDKTLRNNINLILGALKDTVNPQIRNLVRTNIDIYNRFNDDNVKHNHNVNDETAFLIEMTSAIMKYVLIHLR